MKKQFAELPAPLQKAILFRLSGVLLGCIILILALISGGNWMLMFPAAAVSLCALFSAMGLFLAYKEGTILIIEGTCSSLEQSSVRKRVRAIYLRSEIHDIRIMCRHSRLRDLRPGDNITVYLRDNTPVYEMDGCQVICDYIALGKSRTPGSELAH